MKDSMRFKYARYLACILIIILAIAVAACNSDVGQGDSTSTSEANDTSEVSEMNDQQTTVPDEGVSELDNYVGTLKYTVSEDGKSVNISYMLNGEQKSYNVPNNANYLTGGFAATDDLDRALPTSLDTGIYGSNGERYVGIFYFLWHGEHGDTGVYDLQKIMDTYGELAKDANARDPQTGKKIYGAIGQMHWFAEPLYGYYYASAFKRLKRYLQHPEVLDETLESVIEDID